MKDKVDHPSLNKFSHLDLLCLCWFANLFTPVPYMMHIFISSFQLAIVIGLVHRSSCLNLYTGNYWCKCITIFIHFNDCIQVYNGRNFIRGVFGGGGDNIWSLGQAAFWTQYILIMFQFFLLSPTDLTITSPFQSNLALIIS